MDQSALTDLRRQVRTTANALRLADLTGRERHHALVASSALGELLDVLRQYEDREHDQLEITDALEDTR